MELAQLSNVIPYSRVSTGGGGQEPMRALALDPSNSSRIWGQGTVSAFIGYTDDDGVTFHAKVANPDAGAAYGVYQLTFSTNYAWLVTSGLNSQQGRLWRSPLPDASGNGLSWTKKFDLATNGGGNGSGFRNSSFAVREPYCYLAEYGAGGATVMGGPSVFRASNNGDMPPGGNAWDKVKTFSNAKHAHGVKIINAVPWVSTGDTGQTSAGQIFTDVGLWSATDALAGTWGPRSIYGPHGGTVLAMINFSQMSIDGQPVIVGESDGHYGDGPLIFPSTSGTSSMAVVPLCKLPAPYFGSMAGLTETKEGNLMWVTSGEGGAIGPRDAIWIAKTPFQVPLLLESLALNTLSTVGDPVEHGNYVFFGSYRVTKPRFIGQ